MKASELRIGNKVSFFFKEDSVPNEKVIDITLRDLQHIEKYPEFYKPIPITEEWLVKFGINLSQSKKHAFTKDVYENEYGFLMVVDHESVGDGFVKFHQRINFVHELQNKYFYYFDEELTIKE